MQQVIVYRVYFYVAIHGCMALFFCSKSYALLFDCFYFILVVIVNIKFSWVTARLLLDTEVRFCFLLHLLSF